MNFSQWKVIFTSIKFSYHSRLNNSNLIFRIKNELESKCLDTYQKWKCNKFDIDHKFNNKYTLLDIAANVGNTEVVNLLIKNGAVIDRVDTCRITFLCHATMEGNTELVKSLIDSGIGVNSHDQDFMAPLHYAAIKGNIELVKLLISSGAEVNKVDINERTPLLHALDNRYNVSINIELVRFLINSGANVNIADKYGNIPLIFVVRSDNIELAKFMIDNGANVEVTTRNGFTPLYAAVLNVNEGSGSRGMVMLLITHEIKLKGSKAQKPDYLTEHREMSEYWDKCLDEVKRMKEEKIDQGITFYDVLISKDDKLASYIKNKNIKKRLETGNYQTEFPIYASKIQSQYKKGKDRAILLDKGEDSIIKIVDIGCGKHLPKVSSVSEKIVGYLTNDDIENLNKATENLPKGIKRKALFEEGEGSTKYFAVSKAERCSSSLSDTKVESLCQARSMEN